MPVFVPEDVQVLDPQTADQVPKTPEGDPVGQNLPTAANKDVGLTAEEFKNFYFPSAGKDLYGVDYDIQNPNVNDATRISGHLSNPYVPDFVKHRLIDKQQETEALSAATGNNYNPDTSFGDDIFDKATAFNIGKSTSLEDKVAKFKAAYPDGEISLHKFNGEVHMLVRKDAGQPWTKLGLISSEVLPSIVSAKTAGAVAGDILGTAGGNAIFPGLGLVTGPAGAMVGTVLGGAADTGIDKMQGYSQAKKYFDDTDLKEALANGAISFISKGGMTAGTIKSQLDAGQGTKATRDAISFAKENDLPVPNVGEVTASGQAQAVYAQVLRMNPDALEEHIKKRMAVTDKLMSYVNNYGFDGVGQQQLKDLLDTTRAGMGATINSISSRAINSEEGGVLLKKLWDNYDTLMSAKGGVIDKAFREATDLSDNVSFDLSGAKKLNNELIEGVVGKGEAKTIPSPVLGPDGKPLGTVSHIPDIKITEDPKGELLSAMTALKELDPILTAHNSVEGNAFSAFEQLKELRTRFGRLTQSEDPGVAGNAKQIYSALTDTIDTATITTAGMPPEKAKAFTDAWAAASKLFKDYNATSELKVMSKIDKLSPGEYANYSDSLLQPGKLEAVKLISDNIPGAKDTLQKMFINKLIGGERTTSWEDIATNTIDEFRRGGYQKNLDYLMPRPQQEQLLKYAKDRDFLEGSYIAKIAQEDQSASATALQLARQGKASDLSYALKLAGGPKSDLGKGIKAGILQDIHDNASIDIPKYGRVLVQEAFDTKLKEYADKGVLDIVFTPKEIENLSRLSNYAGTVGNVTSHGAGLQLGQQAGNVMRQPLETAQQILEGHEPLGRIWKVFKLPISSRIAGWYLLEAASESGKADLTKSIPYLKIGSMAMNSAAHAHGIKLPSDYNTKEFNKEYAPDMGRPIPENRDAAEFKYPGSTPGFATGAFK